MVSQVKDQEPRRLSVFSSPKPVVKTWDSWRQTGDFRRHGIPEDMGFLKSHWLSVHNRNLSNWLHICQGIGCRCGVTKCGAKRQGQAIKNQIISILPCIFLRWGITGRGYLCLGWVFPYKKKIDACIGTPDVDNSSIETHCLDSMLLKVDFWNQPSYELWLSWKYTSTVSQPYLVLHSCTEKASAVDYSFSISYFILKLVLLYFSWSNHMIELKLVFFCLPA